MTNPNQTVHSASSHSRSLTTLIGALREIDAPIPADVEQELAIQRRVADGLNVEHAATAAAGSLSSVEAKHFDQAVNDARRRGGAPPCPGRASAGA